MRTLIRRENAVNFDKYVREVLNGNQASLSKAENEGLKIVKLITDYYGDFRLGKTASNDLVLECVTYILLENPKGSPTKRLRNLVHERIKEEIKKREIVTPVEEEEVRLYHVDVDSRLIFEEIVKDIVYLLPLHIQSVVLYLIFYPNNDKKFKELYSTIDYFLILRSIKMIAREVGAGRETKEYLNFELPESQTARLILVSSLYKLSPALLVLFMQTKKLDLVLQFCKLFGGEKVSIPTLSQLSSTIEQAALLAKTVEEQWEVPDQQSLAYLATELEEIKQVDYAQLSLNPLLSNFLEDQLEVTLRNYDAYQKRLISGVNTTDPADIMRVYEIMNKEVFCQANLLLQLTTSINDIPSIKNIMNLLKTETKKKHNAK